METSTAAATAAEENQSMADIESFRLCLNGLVSKADELEQRVDEVVDYANENEERKANAGDERRAQKRTNRGRRKAVPRAERVQGLMHEFAAIFEKITRHEWAYPFRDPVDVEGLELSDYYEVIKKPMDFSTIRNRMQAKDGSGYKHVREIYSDVRLIFTNAMTYNDEKHNCHVMAKTLLEKFQEKWLGMLPRVTEEETRQKEEESMKLANMQIAQEAAVAKMAKDTNNELNELNMHLEKLREMVVQKCRKLSTYEKRKLSMDLSSLSREDIQRVLNIISEDNPSYQSSENVAEINLESQSPLTMWKIRYFVKRALELQAENIALKADENALKADENRKQKATCNAVAKKASKRTRKSPNARV